MIEIKISKEYSNQTLIKYLNRFLPMAPKGLMYKQLRNKNIILNGKKCDGSEKLAEGDLVKIFMSDDTIAVFQKADDKNTSEYEKALQLLGKPNIVFEDSHIIILNKPVGVLSQKSTDKDLSVNEWLIGYMLANNEITGKSLNQFTPSVCNRLDRNTGGLITFAKTVFGATYLNGIIKDRSVKKYYQTAVLGKIDEEKYLKGYLSKNADLNKVFVSESYKEGFEKIETAYRPLEYISSKDITLMEVELITGKPHQIRAHMASIGHPVLGDDKYGDKAVNSSLGLKHQILYAYKMIFPVSDEYPELSGKIIEINMEKEFAKIRGK